MEIEIRKAQDSDVPALTDLLCLLGFFARISAEPVESTRERVLAEIILRSCIGKPLQTFGKTLQSKR